MNYLGRLFFANAFFLAGITICNATALAKEIPLDQVPPKVIEAARQAVPEFEILSAEKEREWGQVVYELSGLSAANGQYYEVEVNRKGKVLEIERGNVPEEEREEEEENEDDDDKGEEDEA